MHILKMHANFEKWSGHSKMVRERKEVEMRCNGSDAA